MNTRELRIGNYIQQGKHVYKVRSIVDDTHITIDKPGCESTRYLCNEDENLSDIVPVELDEKWLLDFGFAYDSQNDIYRSGEGCRFSLDLNLNRIFLADTTNTAIPIPVKYLHQLQNLFFALSGDELEFEYRHEFLIDDTMADYNSLDSSNPNKGLCGKYSDHYQNNNY